MFVHIFLDWLGGVGAVKRARGIVGRLSVDDQRFIGIDETMGCRGAGAGFFETAVGRNWAVR